MMTFFGLVGWAFATTMWAMNTQDAPSRNSIILCSVMSILSFIMLVLTAIRFYFAYFV